MRGGSAVSTARLSRLTTELLERWLAARPANLSNRTRAKYVTALMRRTDQGLPVRLSIRPIAMPSPNTSALAMISE